MLRWVLLAGAVAFAAAVWAVFAQPRVTEIALAEPVPLQVLAVRPNNPSLVAIDLEHGTVARYPPPVHALPGDAVDGAVITPGHDTIIWSQGTARLFTQRLNRVKLQLRPEPLRQLAGIAPALDVIPSLDGEAVWLVQPGLAAWDGDTHPTLVERLQLDTARRTLAVALDSGSVPVAATRSGVVVNFHRVVDARWVVEPGSERVAHLSDEGVIQDIGPGRAVAAGSNRVVRAVCPPRTERCEVHVSGVDGRDDRRIPAPKGGTWGGGESPTSSVTVPLPALSPDGTRLVVAVLENSDGKPTRSTLLWIDLDDGTASELIDVDGPPPMSVWSRDGRRVVLIGPQHIRLVDADDPGAPSRVLDVIPADHVPMAAG